MREMARRLFEEALRRYIMPVLHWLAEHLTALFTWVMRQLICRDGDGTLTGCLQSRARHAAERMIDEAAEGVRQSLEQFAREHSTILTLSCLVGFLLFIGHFVKRWQRRERGRRTEERFANRPVGTRRKRRDKPS